MELEEIRDVLEHVFTASDLLDELEAYFGTAEITYAYTYIAQMWDVKLDEDEDEED